MLAFYATSKQQNAVIIPNIGVIFTPFKGFSAEQMLWEFVFSDCYEEWDWISSEPAQERTKEQISGAAEDVYRLEKWWREVSLDGSLVASRNDQTGDIDIYNQAVWTEMLRQFEHADC